MIVTNDLDEAIEVIRTITDEIPNKEKNQIIININIHIGETEDSVAEDTSIQTDEMVVTDLIKRIGIPAHIMGYRYMREAIMICLDDKHRLAQVTKTLYPTIAKNNGTTISRVERAIRHAIEVAWKKGDMDRIQEVFGYSQRSGNNRPTNSEFIAVIVDKLLV